MFFTRSSSDLSMPTSNLWSSRNKQVFNEKSQLWIKSTCSHKASRPRLRRLVLVVFVDVTAAFDTFKHHGFNCKLLRLLSNKHMVRINLDLVENKSFTLTNGDSKSTSQITTPEKRLLLRWVLALLILSIYIYDLLPPITFVKLTYTDDLVKLHSSREWKKLEKTPSQSVINLSAYLHTWRQKLIHFKTETVAFYF